MIQRSNQLRVTSTNNHNNNHNNNCIFSVLLSLIPVACILLFYIFINELINMNNIEISMFMYLIIMNALFMASNIISYLTLSSLINLSVYWRSSLLTNVLEFNITHLYALFGQFLTHDITGVSTSTDSDGTEIDCPCTSTDESCLGIDWPSNDAYLNQTCLNFTRSSAAFPSFNCTSSYREQLNLVSSFIDGSQIYGLDSTRASELRTFSNGLLKTSDGITAANKGITNRTYLPLSSDDTCSSSSTSTYYCFYAGEYRTRYTVY